MLANTHRKLKSYMVLGQADEDQTSNHMAECEPIQPQLQDNPQFTLQTCAAQDYPSDIWAAASRCSDQGQAVLQAYEEVRRLRDTYREQLASLRLSPSDSSWWEQDDGQHLTQPSNITLQQYKSGKQLWSPSSSKKLLPPLTATSPATKTLQSPNSNVLQTAGMLQPVMNSATLMNNNKPFNITQTMQMTRENRKLSLFDEQKLQWSHMEKRLSKKGQRPVADLAMHRGPEYRHKQEILEALHRAKPLEDRVGGPDTWNMSLRNAWERVVPLGSLFSGLTVIIKETPAYQDCRSSKPHELAMLQKAQMGAVVVTQSCIKELVNLSVLVDRQTERARLVKVGRPLSPETTGQLITSQSTKARSLTQRGRTWADSQVLKERLNQYADALNRQLPYQPDMTSLRVTGQSLAAMLESSLNEEITLADLTTHLKSQSPDVAQELQSIQHELQQQEAARQLAEEVNQQQSSQAMNEQYSEETSLASCMPGIHVSCSHDRVVLSCQAGQQTFAQINLRNQGTVALQYQWQCSSPANHPLAGKAQQHQHIYSLQLQGTLLPGDQHTTTIMFTPCDAGIFNQTWQLETIPALPPGHASVSVVISGIAGQPPSGGPALTRLEKQLAEDEKQAKVQAALERILCNVVPGPARTEPETPAHRQAAESWDSANAHEWPPVYWPGETIQQEMCKMYDTSRAALVTALTPPPPPDPPAGKKKSKNKPSVVPELFVPTISWPEAWSLRISDMRGLLDELSTLSNTTTPAAPESVTEAATPAAMSADVQHAVQLASSLRDQFEQLVVSQAVCVPHDTRTLMRHAARAAMLKLADAVEAKATTIHIDYEKRVAEASAAAADTPAAAAAVPPPTAQWLSDKLKSGTKLHVKSLVSLWWDEAAREKAAIAEWLQAAIDKLDNQQSLQVLDQEVNVAAGPPTTACNADAHHTKSTASRCLAEDKGQPSAATDSILGCLPDDEYHWARFALLRCYERLGLPRTGACAT